MPVVVVHILVPTPECPGYRNPVGLELIQVFVEDEGDGIVTVLVALLCFRRLGKKGMDGDRPENEEELTHGGFGKDANQRNSLRFPDREA